MQLGNYNLGNVEAVSPVARNRNMISDLASLLAPLPEQSFLEHFLEKKRLHASGSEPEQFARLLPWGTINRIVEWDVLPADRLNVMRASIELAPLMFRRQDGSQRLDAGRLQALLSQGVSLVINNIDDLVSVLGRLGDAIERRLAHFIAMNAYLSFGRAGAFKPHWDTHDVLVVQIHGSKRWRSYGTPIPYPVESCKPDELPSEIVWEDLLVPGDLLYLPRGEVHEAIVEEKSSVHLTIRIVPRRGVDFLGWLTKKAMDDELLRMDLTRLSGEAALGRHETLLKKQLHALIDSSSLAAFLDSDDRERRPRALFSLGQDDRSGEDTFVVPALRRHTSLLTEGDDEATVTIGGEQYRLSAAARRVLAHLIDRNGSKFRDLSAALGTTVSNEMLRSALSELVERGLAALEPPEPL
jgi:ribosomal protein L16 Arg81 hydroxylase